MRFVLPERETPAADAALKCEEFRLNDGFASVSAGPRVTGDCECSVDRESGGADVISTDIERGTDHGASGDYGGFDDASEDIDSKISDDGSLFGCSGDAAVEPELEQGNKSGSINDGDATFSENQ